MTAIIDIGSNSVRLMLWANGKSLLKTLQTTRLGEGLSISGELSPAARDRTVEAVKRFFELSKSRGASVYAFATAAVRSAKNGRDFCDEVKEKCGLDVDVVSGEEEALLALCGVLGANEDGGILDVGGASTELCLRKGGKIVFSTSLDVGAVRLFDLCGDEPLSLTRYIRAKVSSLPEGLFEGKVYAVGGTASSLACLKLGLERYDGELIQDLPLSCAEVETIAKKLLSMSIEARKELRGMDKSRADILGGGALLIYEIMKKLSLPCVYASDRDNLEGYLIRRGLE